MKFKIIAAVCLMMFSSCVPDQQWYATLHVNNCTDKTIHIESNIKSCCIASPYDELDPEFDIKPNKAILLARTATTLNELIDKTDASIDMFIENLEEAYITASYEFKGIKHSQTWIFADNAKTNGKLFNLKDWFLDDSVDNLKDFWTISYRLDITEDELETVVSGD